MTSLFNQVRNIPKIAQNCLQQLRTLIDISRLIEKFSQLQIAEVDEILRNCSKDAEQLKELLQGLKKGKSRIKTWIKAVGGVMNETKTIGLFGSLEVEKSSLTLCITQVDFVSTQVQDQECKNNYESGLSCMVSTPVLMQWVETWKISPGVRAMNYLQSVQHSKT